jgi:hypothetical protein
MFGLGRKSSKQQPAPTKPDSPSKDELRDHRLATSSGDGGAGGDEDHWDMESIEEARRPSSSRDNDYNPELSDTFVSPPAARQPSPKISKSSKKSSTSTAAAAPAGSSTSAATDANNSSKRANRISSTIKAQKIEASAGTSRLNRILHDQAGEQQEDEMLMMNNVVASSSSRRGSGIVAAIPPVAKPDDEAHVGRYVAQYVVPPLAVDIKSIGGDVVAAAASRTSDKDRPAMPQLTQECLLSMRCKSFDLTKNAEQVALGALQDPSMYAKHKRKLGLWGSATSKLKMSRHHKLRYVCLVRSTNRPLSTKSGDHGVKSNKSDDVGSYDDDEALVDDYENMYNQGVDQSDDPGPTLPEEDAELALGGTAEPKSPEKSEVSSFPVLVCMALQKDGTNPDIRKLVSLEKLVTIQNSVNNTVQLIFEGGDSVWLDFSDEYEHSDDDSAAPQDMAPTSGMRQEQFLWSLLQIQAMLCQSVIERNLKAIQQRQQAMSRGQAPSMQQPLQVRNLDRAELQYVAQVHGFLRDSPTLCALLDRQRDIYQREDEESKEAEDKDLAYDILMGNYTTRVALFTTAEEKADAEDVLNAITSEMPQDDQDENVNKLGEMLQKRMRDLEAETCRRLIAWEDEKHYSMVGESAFDNWDTTVDALSLSALFQTLDLLDKELADMEDWLDERAAVIKPLTDDCREIEEENRQLEQQWKSYDLLGVELKRLLQGVDLDRSAEKILKNPASALVYSKEGELDIEKSDRGVDKIFNAGTTLKDAIDSARQAGGVHLLAVGERVEGLDTTADQFCTSLSHIIVTVMEQLKNEVVAASDHGKVSKHDTHAVIARKIKEVSASRGA